jgi:hypothetical protein
MQAGLALWSMCCYWKSAGVPNWLWNNMHPVCPSVEEVQRVSGKSYRPWTAITFCPRKFKTSNRTFSASRFTGRDSSLFCQWQMPKCSDFSFCERTHREGRELCLSGQCMRFAAEEATSICRSASHKMHRRGRSGSEFLAPFTADLTTRHEEIISQYLYLLGHPFFPHVGGRCNDQYIYIQVQYPYTTPSITRSYRRRGMTSLHVESFFLSMLGMWMHVLRGGGLHSSPLEKAGLQP